MAGGNGEGGTGAGGGVAGAPSIDTSTAHPARVYDYWLGGKDNFAADREAAELALQAYPQLAEAVQSNRAFLARAVRYLTQEAASGSSSTSGPASRPPTTPTKSPSARPRTHGSSMSTTTPSCCCTRGRC
jgi:hypothetical protein